MIKCFSIFGDNNCDRVGETFYYTRKCPKGYFRQGLGCVFDCSAYNFQEKGEYCEKLPDQIDIPCPPGTVIKNDSLCLKPLKRYFVYTMNPFNNKLWIIILLKIKKIQLEFSYPQNITLKLL